MGGSFAARRSFAVILFCLAGLAAAPSMLGQTPSKEPAADSKADNKAAAPLDPDEPAAAILRLRKSLGSKYGTDDQAFVDAVRQLEKQANRDQAGPGAADKGQDSQTTDVPLAQIAALRKAARRVDEAAEVLEDQNLYHRADELRRQADQLRADARRIAQGRAPSD